MLSGRRRHDQDRLYLPGHRAHRIPAAADGKEAARLVAGAAPRGGSGGRVGRVGRHTYDRVSQLIQYIAYNTSSYYYSSAAITVPINSQTVQTQ